ncbi:SigE family RNA polymerase sigma factor [Dactylosporangium sp. McL0621]|uniref:SigE family RNA polymerase sigma factor n=1 Tax=Dactylosporangium sp. McL0621 TaxID=3415678 RepID=UPI003CE70015
MKNIDRDFEAFVQSRAHALLRVAYLLVGDEQLAQDHLQDVLMRMYQRWPRVQQEPDRYARAALINRTTDHWRRRSRRREASMPDGLTVVAADDTAAMIGRRTVLDALSVLTARQRAVIVLRYLEDLPVAEVAAMLRCSEGAVQSHAGRGLAKLRELLPSLSAALNGDSHV